MSSDLQDRITAARREAEGLKEKIKRKKDELADADCVYFLSSRGPLTRFSRSGRWDGWMVDEWLAD